jgi:hypothetical protein
VSDLDETRLTTEQLANPGAAAGGREQSAERGEPTRAGTDGAGQHRADDVQAVPDGAGQAGTDDVRLLDPQDHETMTRRWRDIQADFVDHPRQAMQDADALVAGLMQHLAQTFAQERQQLEGQWSRGDQVSTEDLRVSLQRYRAFFERLLSV